MEMCGYEKEEVEHISLDEISLDWVNGVGYIVVKDEKLDVEYEFSLDEYIRYADWWTAIERNKKIDEILKD